MKARTSAASGAEDPDEHFPVVSRWSAANSNPRLQPLQRGELRKWYARRHGAADSEGGGGLLT